MTGSDIDRQLRRACDEVRARTAQRPLVGLVLGSGLGAFAERLQGATSIPYTQILGMSAPTVSGHAGMLHIGRVASVPVACLQGRVHLYEGHPPARAVFGVRMLARLGCAAVLLTNAAGGIRPSFEAGTLMLIRDHLNLTGVNPLVGPNPAALGPRFPDMSCAYDDELRAAAKQAAASCKLGLEEGVYAALSGPSYETPAEIHMLRTLGADAVGMSTVPEVIALRHMGVRCGAISCITNLAAGIGGAPLDHAEVEQTAARVRATFVELMAAWIDQIAASLAKA